MSLCIVLFRSTKQLAHSKEPFSINNVSINRRHLWDLWRFWLSFLLDIIDKFRFVRNLLTSPDTFRINWEVSPALYSGARFDYLTIWLLTIVTSSCSGSPLYVKGSQEKRPWHSFYPIHCYHESRQTCHLTTEELKGHSQLAQMRITYHSTANLHITETR